MKMKKIKSPKDMIWRCIRINDGQVYYFNGAGILTTCSIDEAFSNKIDGIRKESICSHALIEKCSIYGITENAFDRAAARVNIGCTIEDFINEAIKIT